MNIQLRITNYINRYAPSKKKLSEYISKKKPTFHIEEFIEQSGYLEKLMIDIWIRTFLAQSVGEKSIYIKLLKKGFPKKLIEDTLERNTSLIHDWSIHSDTIIRKIQSLQAKNKSKQSIYQTLTTLYPYFRDDIKSYIGALSDEGSIEVIGSKYRDKYTLSIPEEKQKYMNTLLRRGFSYESIKGHLREIGFYR